MILKGCDAQGDVITQVTYYSIGGGFVLTADELAAGADKEDGAHARANRDTREQHRPRFPLAIRDAGAAET